MNRVFGWLRRLFGGLHPHVGWFLGLVIVAAIAAYLWIGRDTDNKPPDPAVAVTPPAEDVLPPAEPDSEATPPPDTAGQSGDIIPPEEP